MLRDFKKEVSPGSKLSGKNANRFLDLFKGNTNIPGVNCDDLRVARKWLDGFRDSIAHAEMLKALDPSLTKQEIKYFTQQLVNKGAKLDDFARLKGPLAAARKLSPAARLAKYGPCVGKLSLVFAAVGMASSAHTAIAGGGITDRMPDDPLAVRIVNQMGYDAMFGEEVEQYLFPQAPKAANWLGRIFGLSDCPENRQTLRRSGVTFGPEGLGK